MFPPSEDDLDDELALFEKQIEQVSSATASSSKSTAAFEQLTPSKVTHPSAKLTFTPTEAEETLSNVTAREVSNVSGSLAPARQTVSAKPVVNTSTYPGPSNTRHSVCKALSQRRTQSHMYPGQPTAAGAVVSLEPKPGGDPPDAMHCGSHRAFSANHTMLGFERTKIVKTSPLSSEPLHAKSNSNAPESSDCGLDSKSLYCWKWNGQTWQWVPRNNPELRKSEPSTFINLNALPRTPNSANLMVPTATPVYSSTDGSASTCINFGISGTTTGPTTINSGGSSHDNTNPATAKRTAAGAVWRDTSLEEWPSDDHRLFVGDLGPDANDSDLESAFSKYPSFNMARVVKDRRTATCRGYGFVSFASAHDMLTAIKEMNGKYVGSRPVKLRKSSWEKRTLSKDKWKQVRAIRTISKR